jgi:type I restriction enzyme S subunit
MENAENGILFETEEFISADGLKNIRGKTFPTGTLLFAMYGSIGKTAISGKELSTNQAILGIRPKRQGDIAISYLKSWFDSNKQRLINQGRGVALKNLSATIVRNLEIELPPLADQIRIAYLLGKVEGLISQRRQHLQQLDALVSSVFIEMFGDIRAQKSDHPWTELRPYLKANSGKSSKSVISESETGIPIFGGNGVNGWATKSLYEIPVVVAGRVGQQCGVIHVSKGPCWVTDNAIVLSISDNSRLNIVYLAKAFHYAPIRERVKQLDLPFINQSMLLDYLLPLPPIDLQNRFAVIVEAIENVHALYQRSLIDLETLYDALSQQVFKGEFDLSRVPMPGEGPEEDEAVGTDPLHTPAELGFDIDLPDTENLLDALDNAEARENLISHWLEAYRGQLGRTPFSVQHFMTAAQTHMAEVHPDTEFKLGAKDYECIKTWIFGALANGTLKQTFDEAGNRIQLEAAQA